ncbi:MAG: hypothetical protein HC934_07140 [Acaryochloridaceae cyanobacterium SU_2_1]|nr:hypothetical protein [Acaryochloridaceae cyanobacterium SU_2_1]
MKQQSLGDLLQQLLVAYPTQKALEQQLVHTAAQIETLDQGLQIAQGILRAVQPMYVGSIPSDRLAMQTSPRSFQMEST